MGITTERNKFRVRVSKDGVRHNIGLFDTPQKAKRALNKWKRENADPIEQLPYQPESDEMFTATERAHMQKPTLKQRVINAYNAFRSSTGTEK